MPSDLGSPPVPTAAPFTLAAADFAEGAPIPPEHTCQGADTSPALHWSGAPAGTAALVLLVDDPDASGWVHWIVLDIPGASTGDLPPAIGPTADLRQGTTSWGTPGWRGPCPPSGTHHYRFSLYALAEPLGLPGRPDGTTVRAALMKARVLATTTLTGTYRKG